MVSGQPRNLPDPGFSGDDGAAAPEVTTALAAYDEMPAARHLDALAVVQHARLLVPVVAVLGESAVDEAGLTRDKSSDMAAVLMRGRDGRTALLAFTGSEAMARWDPDARPVPVTASDAARAARAESAEALVVDVAGPVTFVVERGDLESLAEGWTLAPVRGGGWAWAKPDR